jgi:hypothetical protein
MTPALDAALAECDELNIALWVQDGKLSFRSGEFGFPDRLRDTLRTHRDELFTLLSDDQRSHPEWVPFIARNLDVRWFEFPLVKDVVVLLVSQRPYYRLTAATWVRVALAVDQRAASVSSDPVAFGEMRQAAELLVSLGEWINLHYRPDQIRRAFANPLPLPRVPRGPIAFPDEVVAPCPPNPKPSACVPSRPRRKTARQRMRAAMTATGNDCASLF